MSKITVILTGGTIGSETRGDYTGATSETAVRIIDLYAEKYEKRSEFTVKNPYTLLSENLSGYYLKQLRMAVENAIETSPDGIIITHGTDTLQYSAAYLSYIIENLSIPIIMVCSNYPLSDERANGLTNFAAAVAYIEDKNDGGLFVSYRNDLNGEVFFHNGLRLLSYETFSDKLHSAIDIYYGKFVRGKFAINPLFIKSNEKIIANEKAKQPTDLHENMRRRIEKTSEREKDQPKVRSLSSAEISEESPILWLFEHPNMFYPRIDKKIKAVLISAYHSGTLCVDERFITYVTELKMQRIPVYVSGAMEGVKYESIREIEDKVIFLPKIAPIAAYMKMWLIYASGLDESLVTEKYREDIII